MSDQTQRRRPRFEPIARPSGERKERSFYPDGRDRPPPGHVGESIDFDPPTNPRGRKFFEPPTPPPEALAEPEPQPRRAHPDSFQPVRVAPRSVRPTLSLWTRAWGTGALIIAVGGGAVGVVRSIRSRPIASTPPSDVSGKVTAAAPSAVAAEPKPPVSPAPSALPVETFPSAQPSTAASVLPPAVPQAITYAVPGAPMPAPPRTAVPRANGVAPAVPLPRSNKQGSVTNWRPVTPPHDDLLDVPLRAPASSASPAASGTPEAWVTEERRF